MSTPRFPALTHTLDTLRNLRRTVIGTTVLAWHQLSHYLHSLRASEHDTPPLGTLATAEEYFTAPDMPAPNFFQRRIQLGQSLEGDAIEDEYGTTPATDEKNSWLILATQYYVSIRRFFSGTYALIAQSTHDFQTRALAQGAATENQMRRSPSKKTPRKTAAYRKQQLLHRMGLVSNEEFQQLRAELHQLKSSIEIRNVPPLSMIMAHDRRHHERRQEHLTVAYERRTLQRRA